MDGGLPGYLLDEVLFMIDLRALAVMRCTNKSLQSHTNDPYFESEYFSRIPSDLLYISAYGSHSLCYHHLHGGSRSLKRKDFLLKCHILGVCSGLLLLHIDDSLCVSNPFTKKFRYLNHSSQMMRFTSHQEVLLPENKKQLGLAVNQIDPTTQSFKIVYISEMETNNETRYGFEIYAGNSWRCSETMITCHSSDLDYCMPVFWNGSLHWLRNDGSILAFNPETEQARLIPVKCPQGISKTLFAAGDDRLTLISATNEVIYVFALENIFSDPKWVLVKKIRDGVMDKKRLKNWYVEAYDGKCLVLCEKGDDRVVHVYDLRANKWVVMGSYPAWCDAKQDFFQFTPSPSSVVGFDEILACGDIRISSLSSILALIDGSSSEEVETQLWKMLAEEEEKNL